MLDRNAGTIWVALSEVTIDMGAMHFIPGSHRMQIDGWEHTIKEDSDSLDEIPFGLQEQAIAYDLKPGDATFHHGLTIHYTGENKSDKICKGMCVIYFPDGVRYNGKCPEHTTTVRRERNTASRLPPGRIRYWPKLLAIIIGVIAPLAQNSSGQFRINFHCK
jgi:hypothetical protein